MPLAAPLRVVAVARPEVAHLDPAVRDPADDRPGLLVDRDHDHEHAVVRERLEDRLAELLDADAHGTTALMEAARAGEQGRGFAVVAVISAAVAIFAGGAAEFRHGNDHGVFTEITEIGPERVVATMPVEGNRQPFGLLHGGASAALAD